MSNYYILKHLLNVNEPNEVIEPYEVLIRNTRAEAYEAFAKECYPGTYWELADTSIFNKDRLIGVSVSVPDIQNELHQVTLLIYAEDEDKRDEIAADYILEFLADYHKERWLEEHLSDHDIFKVLIDREGNPTIEPKTVKEANDEYLQLRTNEFYELIDDMNLSHILSAWHYKPDDSETDNEIIYILAKNLEEVESVLDDFFMYRGETV